jgi:HK97 family phage portal protein
MAFFDKIFKRKQSFNINTINFASSFDNHIGQDATSWAAIDLIASSFANLNGYFFGKDNKQALKEHYLYDLLNTPNQDETKFQFLYNSVKDYFQGNCYWYKYDNTQGEIVALFRLNPNQIGVSRNNHNQKIFTYKGLEYTSDKILHIPSRYGYDGLKGKSIFSECNQVFNNTSELDSYINNSFSNSIGNRLIIDVSREYPDITEDQINQLKSKFIQNYAGIKNAGKPLIKSGKIEYNKIESDIKDNKSQQLLENREFQQREISKLFGIPLSLLTGGEKENNIESLYILFIENAIRPVATQFEQSINKMIPATERSRVYFEYSYNSLMKVSLQTRIDSYAKQLTNGILTPNEIRRKENLPEVEAGDTVFLQANLMPLKQDIVDSYMASAKIKQEKLNIESPNTHGNHSNLGDDKI